MIPAFYYTNCLYKWCELLSWATNIAIIQPFILPWTWQDDPHTIKTPCLLHMIDSHTLYKSNLFNLTGGHSTMAMVRRPPHYQDIIKIWLFLKNVIFYNVVDWLIDIDHHGGYAVTGNGNPTPTLSVQHFCHPWYNSMYWTSILMTFNSALCILCVKKGVKF